MQTALQADGFDVPQLRAQVTSATTTVSSVTSAGQDVIVSLNEQGIQASVLSVPSASQD